MSEDDIGLEIEEDSGNETSPEKSERKESRELIEEPGDDDGENRHPTEHNSMLYTALIVVKGMIGAGILNLPLIIKTFGFIGGSILTFFLAFIAITVAYYLGRDKDITQRYSYAVYSKLMMGTAGTLIMKISLIIMLSTLAIVQLIVFGDVLKGLSLLFYDINVKMLILAIALILLPFMFQKDISGITKYAYFGIIGLGVFCVAHIILFIHNKVKVKVTEANLNAEFFIKTIPFKYNYDEQVLTTGRVGTLGVVNKYKDRVYMADNVLVIKSQYYEYCYQILQQLDYNEITKGGVQSLITQTDLKAVEIIIPDTNSLKEYEDTVLNVFKMIETKQQENSKLSELQTLLLAKMGNLKQ